LWCSAANDTFARVLTLFMDCKRLLSLKLLNIVHLFNT
jgi:hypothetical protein